MDKRTRMGIIYHEHSLHPHPPQKFTKRNKTIRIGEGGVVPKTALFYVRGDAVVAVRDTCSIVWSNRIRIGGGGEGTT